MKKLLSLGAALLAATAAWAAPLTPSEALARLSDSRMKAPGTGVDAPELVHTAMTAPGEPAVYVFNRAPGAGYMLVSADDVAYPLLGYADTGRFDPENIAPALQWWLDEYSRQIEYAATHAAATQAPGSHRKPPIALRDPIAPLVQTRWDQIEPFNGMCPLVGVERTFTGCVATAMAQVMKYWNYPARGTGSVSYNCTSIEKKLSMDFSAKAFDWSNMLDSYSGGNYTQEQADAVAYLMKACGYAVKMEYSTDSSGALAMNIRAAMLRFFDYDANSSYHLRMMYSTSEWEELIYNALKVGPILYGGGSFLGGGHSFVCDGYDGLGYFHFNWGWSGMSDGYYMLDALNPDALGSGGGSGGGYNFTQDAVINLRPSMGAAVEEPENQLVQMGSLIGIVENDSLKLDLDMQQDAMWVNYNPSTMYVKFGAHFEPATGGEPFDVEFRPDLQGWKLEPGYGTSPYYVHPAVDLANTEIPDGSYRVSVYTKAARNANAEWIPTRVPYGYISDVTFTKINGACNVTYGETPVITIESAQFTTPLYNGCTQNVRVTLRNDNDMELSMGLAPLLFNNEGIDFLGESVLVTVPAHSRIVKEWNTSLYQLRQYVSVTEPTKYMFTFMDENSYMILADNYLSQVTMLPVPDAPEVSLISEPVISGATVQTVQSTGNAYYLVNDPMEMPVEVNLLLSSGYFSYPVYANLCVPAGDGYYDITAQSSTYLYMDSDKPRGTANVTLSYPLMEPGVNYLLIMGYAYMGSLEIIPPTRNNFVRLAESGVDDVAVDGGTVSIFHDRDAATLTAVSASGIVSFEAYTVTGAWIGSAVLEGNTAVITLPEGYHGVVIATARDAAGNVKTLKTAR